jgi:holo-[acyl-carrier protein] synthase
MRVLGVGTDILDEERIARLLHTGGSRFLAHWYTADEIALCARASRPERVAGRCFAVKEAALKAVGASFPGPVRWREIEVLTDGRGSPVVGLWGETAAHAARVGVRRLHASTARTPGWIAAVVVAEG